MRNLQTIGAQIEQSKYANVEIGSSEGLESIIAEVAVEAADIDADGAMHADLGNVIASLECIADQAGASIADGGLDRQSAGILEVAVESHLGRVGLTAGDAMVSVESFGGSSTQLEATQVSVEAIKEKAKQLWAFLVKKFKEAREKIFVWFKKVFSGAAQLKSRAESIAKKAVDKKGEKKEGAEDIKLGGAAKVLSGADGKADIAKLDSDVKALVKAAQTVYGSHAKNVGDFAGTVASIIDKVAGADKGDLEGSKADKFYASGKFMGEDVLGSLGGSFPEGTLLGGRSFTVVKAGEAADMTALKSAIDKFSVTFSFGTDGKQPKVAEDQMFKAIEPGKVKDLAEEVVTLAESIIAFEADYFKHAKNLEKADASADKAGAALSKVTLGSAGSAAEKVTRSLYTAAQNANQQPVNGFTAAILASARGALEVCEKSLAQYS